MSREATDASSSGTGSPEETKISQTIRSCRGCLYYSSVMRERGQNPICLGLSRSSEPQVYSVHNELDSEVVRNFRDSTYFKYVCTGYSAHREVSSNQSMQPIESPAELPYCVGLEFLIDRKPTRQVTPAETAPLTRSSTYEPPERPHKEDSSNIMPRPSSSIGSMDVGGLSANEFATRLFRTSRLVASAVVNNVGRVANNVRSTIDKIFTSDQGRPKP